MLPLWFLAELIFSTLKMEAICSSGTSVDTHLTTRRYIPEDCTLYNHRCENLRSSSNVFCSCTVRSQINYERMVTPKFKWPTELAITDRDALTFLISKPVTGHDCECFIRPYPSFAAIRFDFVLPVYSQSFR
jgi:hypothetical protein